MLPLHTTQLSLYNYDEIPAGYYYRVMLEGRPEQRFWHKKKFAEVASHLPQEGQILDIGCGPGSFLDVMARERPRLRGLGVDIASSQIEFAREHIASKHGGRISFESVRPCGPIPYPDRHFDAVTCIEVIEHIHPFLALRLLNEARRVLKPNGRLVVTTPNYRSASSD
jgi:2-polyprenyl-3-methyl-5-hydroxy-6-metoxy-1,4-benzoquinol methylase